MVRTGLTQDIRFPLHALEIGANFRRVLVADVPVFLQTRTDNAVQLRWNLRIETGRSRRTLVQDGIEDSSGCLTAERRSRGSHLIEHYRKGEQIGSCMVFTRCLSSARAVA